VTRLSTARATLLVVLVATLPKLFVVLAPRADLYVVGKQGLGVTHVGEELHRGTTALELLDGPILGVLDYQFAPFFGGSLVVALLAVPLFALFGPSITTLKLTTLAFGGVAAALLFLILERFVSRRAAWFGGLLFALPAPGYALVSITAFGSHVEGNALALALFYLYLRTWHSSARPGLRSAFLTGLVAGFAVYFGYIVLIAIGVLAAFRLLCDKLFFARRELGAAALGFALGLAPWLAYNVSHGFAGLSIYGRTLGGNANPKRSDAGFLERVADLAWRAFPDSFFLGALGPAWNVVFALSFVALAAGGVYAARSSLGRVLRAVPARGLAPAALHPVLLFAAYPLAFALAYGVTDFKVGQLPDAAISYRYVYVTYPFLCLAAGVGLDALAGAGRAARAAAVSWALALCAAGLFATLRMADPARLGADFATPGYSYAAFGRFVALTYVDDAERLRRAVDGAVSRRPPEVAHELFFGMGMQLEQTLAERDPSPRFREIQAHAEAARAFLMSRVPEQYRPYFERRGPGAPRFGPADREAFWEWYRRR